MTINLDEIRDRAKAATPGPWAVPVANAFWVIAPGEEYHNVADGRLPPYPWRVIANLDGFDGSAADALFIAYARSDVVALCDEIEMLRKSLAKSRGQYSTIIGHAGFEDMDGNVVIMSGHQALLMAQKLEPFLVYRKVKPDTKD